MATIAIPSPARASRLAGSWRFVQSNKMLAAGVTVILLLFVVTSISSVFMDPERADVGAGKPAKPPSWVSGGQPGFLLGTDQQGRDVFADIVLGTPATLRIGLIAGVLGVLIGVFLGFSGGYFGGVWDGIIVLVSDVFLTVPTLMILIVVASMVKGLSVEAMGLLIASLAWPAPTRIIRSQVLTLRERAYIQVAKLNGQGDFKIIIREMIPNMLPFLAAGLVGATAGGVLASIGLSALGLGPQNEPSLGLTVYWALFYGALIREMWWWLGPPMVVIVVLFVGLFMAAAGLDQIANPRLRSSV